MKVFNVDEKKAVFIGDRRISDYVWDFVEEIESCYDKKIYGCIAQNEKQISYYSPSGKQIFVIIGNEVGCYLYPKCEKICVVQDGKKGLYSYDGKLVIPIEYDEIEDPKSKDQLIYKVIKDVENFEITYLECKD